ncbi:hypothetical protein [Streptosporangium sp. CA-115845]|uniref:hypothetical protein n=1 Tax=Streptosporangium sp. CA-115845 TaxID=3240071 RepID=UPI003D92718A
MKALSGAGLVRDNTARAGSASAIEITPEGARLMREAMKAVAGIYNLLWAIVVVLMIVRPGAQA